MNTPNLILLHPDDNVLVCAGAINAGAAMEIEGMALNAPESVAVGHTLARRALAAGDKVVKYGAPIGSMTRPVERGFWVYVHNMKSDNIASHDNAGRILEGEATLETVGEKIYERVLEVAAGRRTVSEDLGHQESILTYKAFDPIGPSCLPLGAGGAR